MTQPIFDGHNDLLSRLWAMKDRHGEAFLEGWEGAVSLPHARAGGLAGGFFAVWVPGDPKTAPDPTAALRAHPPVNTDTAHRVTMEQASILIRLDAERPDTIRLCRSVAEIEAARTAGAVAALLHVEGCEGIGEGLDELHVLHAAGLRSLGPVWSRSNIFGHGVPFNFPASPDTGPGLTDAGRRLVAECDRLGVLVDLAHINEQGFWDVAAVSHKPLVSTHSAAHAVCPATRNLTDRQLDAIRDSGGLVGINFGVSFLDPEGRRDVDMPLSGLVRHIDYIAGRIGIEHVALGSDFDGTTIPAAIRSADDLPLLVQAIRDAGYGAEDLAKITHGNWLRVLETTWGV